MLISQLVKKLVLLHTAQNPNASHKHLLINHLTAPGSWAPVPICVELHVLPGVCVGCHPQRVLLPHAYCCQDWLHIRPDLDQDKAVSSIYSIKHTTGYTHTKNPTNLQKHCGLKKTFQTCYTVMRYTIRLSQHLVLVWFQWEVIWIQWIPRFCL